MFIKTFVSVIIKTIFSLERKNVPAITLEVPGQASTSKSAGNCYIPDYSVKAISDLLYLKIDKTTYLRARKTSIMKRPLQVTQLCQRSSKNRFITKLWYKSLA
jgi:hypothetical protein